MGIDGLWKEIKPCGRVVKFSELSSILSTDRIPKIAIDANIVLFSISSVIWELIFDKANYDNLNEDYLVHEICRGIRNKNESFKKENMEPVWCLDGDRTKFKLATGKRIKKDKCDYDSLVFNYIKAKKSAPKNSESEKRIKELEIIEKVFHRSKINEESVIYDPTKDSFPSYYSKTVQCLRNINYPIITQDMRKKIHALFTSPGFEMIQFPEISESEKLCSILTHIGYCQAVYSTDSDCVLFGAKYIIKKPSPREKGSNYGSTDHVLYSYNDITNFLKKSPSRLFTQCVLYGTDFNERMSGYGEKGIKDFVKQNPTVDLYDLNIQHCDLIKPDICYEFLTISEEEKKMVRDFLLRK